MSFTVTATSPTTLLTTVARVKDELAVTSSSDDALFDDLVRRASAAVEAYTHRIFARQTYTQVGPAYGGVEFITREAPIAALGTVTFDSSTLTDVSIQDKEQGVLYREDGFMWTAQRYGGLSAVGGWLSVGHPIPGQDEPLWSVSYTAGFILPSQNILNSATVSADATDDSFNDSASAFPTLLKAGDIIETTGWTNAANNGRYIVSGTPTASKIIVDAALTTEAAAAGTRDVLVQTLPYDIEKATIETVKSFYAARGSDSRIVEKQAGLMRLRYSEQGGSDYGIPPSAVGLLRPYVRVR